MVAMFDGSQHPETQLRLMIRSLLETIILFLNNMLAKEILRMNKIRKSQANKDYGDQLVRWNESMDIFSKEDYFLRCVLRYYD